MDHDWTKWDTTPIERVHTQFLKRLLGVNRSTTNVLARSELGRHSLQESILTRNINYVKYVEMKNPLSLVKQAITYEKLHHEKRTSIFSLFKRYEANLVSTQFGTEASRDRSDEIKLLSTLPFLIVGGPPTPFFGKFTTQFPTIRTPQTKKFEVTATPHRIY